MLSHRYGTKRILFAGVCVAISVLTISCDRAEENADGAYIANKPDRPHYDADPEETLAKLLTAVDQRDYAAIKVYADDLFQDRADLEIRPEIKGLRDPILRASIDGDVRLFESLVSAGPAFGGADERGRRAIHLAAINNHPEMIRWLCEYVEANPNDRVRVVQDTPLHLAAAANATDAVTILLVLGADLNAKDALGRTALHKAVEAGMFDAARVLLNNMRGLESTKQTLLETRDDAGDTALHASVRAKNPELVRLLIEFEASTEIRNEAGQTPKDLARAIGLESIETLLP